MDKEGLPLKFKAVYYKKGHLWHGDVAIKKLTKAVPGSSAAEAKEWLLKQPIYPIYMPAPSYIPRRKFVVSVPNEVHQIDVHMIKWVEESTNSVSVL